MNMCRHIVVKQPLKLLALKWREWSQFLRNGNQLRLHGNLSGNDASPEFEGIIIRFIAFSQRPQQALLRLTGSFVVTIASICVVNALESPCCVVSSAVARHDERISNWQKIPVFISYRKDHIVRAVSALYTPWSVRWQLLTCDERTVGAQSTRIMPGRRNIFIVLKKSNKTAQFYCDTTAV